MPPPFWLVSADSGSWGCRRKNCAHPGRPPRIDHSLPPNPRILRQSPLFLPSFAPFVEQHLTALCNCLIFPDVIRTHTHTRAHMLSLTSVIVLGIRLSTVSSLTSLAESSISRVSTPATSLSSPSAEGSHSALGQRAELVRVVAEVGRKGGGRAGQRHCDQAWRPIRE